MTQPPDQNPADPSPPHVHEPGHPIEGQGFEFSHHQDDVILKLSRRMRFVGIFFVVSSGIVGIAALVAFFLSPLLGLFYLLVLMPELLVGIWTIHASSSFRRVVETRGQDIPHLMIALSSLRKLYTLMFWLLVAALAFMILAIVAGVFFWMTGMMPGSGGGSVYTMLGM